MISWLKGEIVDTWVHASRTGLVISCSGVGYEVQILKRDIELINEEKEVILWTHQIQREDSSCLIGFLEKTDRDLFRKLITVSGVGTQLAIALLESKEANKLVEVITQKRVDQLIKCPGIGKRIAERLVVELHNKLLDFSCTTLNTKPTGSLGEGNLHINIANEVKSALINLGYEETEIENALRKYEKSANCSLSKTIEAGQAPQIPDFDTLFKQSLIIINTETR